MRRETNAFKLGFKKWLNPFLRDCKHCDEVNFVDYNIAVIHIVEVTKVSAQLTF